MKTAKSLKLGKISPRQAILLVVIVLLLLGSGYLYLSYPQEKPALLDTELVTVTRQVNVLKQKYAEYGVSDPGDKISRLQEVLAEKQTLALASEGYFPQKVEGADIFNLIVTEAGDDIILEKLETSPPVKRTVGTGEYQALQYAVTAYADKNRLPQPEDQLNQIKEWLKGIEENSLVKTLYAGDIQLSFDGTKGIWRANFIVTVLTQ